MEFCFNCEKPATYEVGPRSFCIDCFETILRIEERRREERQLQSIQRANMFNFILERAEGMSVGPPGFLGRMPVPQIALPNVKREITLNNINIDRSTIGILNTGQMQEVEKIDVSVSILGQTNETDIAEAFRALTEAIVSNGEVSAELRSELLEQIQELSSRALLPPDQRKTGVIRPFVDAVSSGLNTVSALATIWATWGNTIRSYFGL